MVIIKADHQLEQVSFIFDETGEVADVTVTVNYALKDDATGQEETRVRKSFSAWTSLSASQRTGANAIGKRLKTLAATL